MLPLLAGDRAQGLRGVNFFGDSGAHWIFSVQRVNGFAFLWFSIRRPTEIGMDRSPDFLDNPWVNSAKARYVPSWEHLLNQVKIEFGSAILHKCPVDWQCPPRVMPD